MVPTESMFSQMMTSLFSPEKYLISCSSRLVPMLTKCFVVDGCPSSKGWPFIFGCVWSTSQREDKAFRCFEWDIDARCWIKVRCHYIHNLWSWLWTHRHGDLLFLSYSNLADTPSIPQAKQPFSSRLNGQVVLPGEDISLKRKDSNDDIRKLVNPWESVIQDAIDSILEKQDGKIPRGRDHKMCKHGPKGMCDYCMPLEPYDAAYLAEKKIKHLSFHS